jgi:beta-galactosidase
MPAMSEMKRDLENLKRHGFNLIKIQEHWAVDEPREGHCDFSLHEELIDYCRKLDLGVYLGLTCEQAPMWLWRKHPDCRMVARDGTPVAYQAPLTLPADGKPGPCFDHPGARADQARFISRLVQTLGRYENIVVWNTWQEIGYWADADFLVGQPVCYCPSTLAFFRSWLRERYGDLDAINRHWRTRFGDWEDILPTRSKRGRDCGAVDVAWAHFIPNVKMAHTLRDRAAVIKAADPLKRPVFAHKGSCAIGSGQDWTFARCQDFLGSSCYPSWFPAQAWDDIWPPGQDRREALAAEIAGLALNLDYLRSASKPDAPVWAAEFQGGPISAGLHKSRVPDPADIRRWMLTAVGSGITGLCFWVTRAEIAGAECNGFSLLDSGGDTTPRYEEAARIGAALGRWPDLFAARTLEPARLAILINEANSNFGASLPEQAGHLEYAVRGWHRILWEAGVAADFVNVDDLDELGSGCAAAILPFPVSISDDVVAKLRRFVERGGHLISEAAIGRWDEVCFCNRGEVSPAAAELFGARQRSFTMVAEPGDRPRWSPRARSWGDYLPATMLQGTGLLKGRALRANVYVQTFEPNRSEVVLCHGKAPAGVVTKVGKGRAWLLGTFLGHNGTAHCDRATRRFVTTLLDRCGIEPSRAGRLLVRRRIAAGRQAWILTNPTARPVTQTLGVSGFAHVEDLLGGDIARRRDRVTLTLDGLDVRVLILS